MDIGGVATHSPLLEEVLVSSSCCSRTSVSQVVCPVTSSGHEQPTTLEVDRTGIVFCSGHNDFFSMAINQELQYVLIPIRS